MHDPDEQTLYPDISSSNFESSTGTNQIFANAS
jgi:hypothetical protein